MLATGERRQRLGDLAAGTVIVVDASGPAPVATAPVAEEAGRRTSVRGRGRGPSASRRRPPRTTRRPRPRRSRCPRAPGRRRRCRPDRVECRGAGRAGRRGAGRRRAGRRGGAGPEVEPVDEEPARDVQPVAGRAGRGRARACRGAGRRRACRRPRISTSSRRPSLSRSSRSRPSCTSPSPSGADRGSRGGSPSRSSRSRLPSRTSGGRRDEPVNVKSVETVSAIDLIMGGDEPEDAGRRATTEPARRTRSLASAGARALAAASAYTRGLAWHIGTTEHPLRVAIVGSGPVGLLRGRASAEVQVAPRPVRAGRHVRPPAHPVGPRARRRGARPPEHQGRQPRVREDRRPTPSSASTGTSSSGATSRTTS